MLKGIWYLVKVENEKDIGIDEIERWKVVDSNTTSVNIGGDFNYQSMNIKCDKAVPASSTTQNSETENSQSIGGEIGSLSMANALMEKIANLENRIQAVEKATLDKLYDEVHISQNDQMLKVLYQTQPEANRWFKEDISKGKQEMESRTEQLSDDIKELKDAFEAECDHYDSDIKCLRQQLSELQQAFVIKGLCKQDIEAGQFVVKNKDGSIRPCNTGETPTGISIKPIYCKECGEGFAQLNIDENGICCMCSQLEKYRENPPAEPDPLEEADKQLKEILRNLTKEQPNMGWVPDKTMGKPYRIKVTTDTEKGIRIEFV